MLSFRRHARICLPALAPAWVAFALALGIAATAAAQDGVPAQQVYPGGRKIVVGLPRPQPLASGELRVAPNVRIAAAPATTGDTIGPLLGPGEQLVGPLPSELLPPPQDPGAIPWNAPPAGEHFGPGAEPLFEQLVEEAAPPPFYKPVLGPLERLFGPRTEDAGIGTERLAYAPMVIEITQPQNQYRLRVDAVHNFASPDRAEILFAAPPKGPAVERAVDYQDLRFQFEAGGPAFSAATELPIRILDPELAPNTAGFGDMNVTTKVRLLDGSDWQLTQFFRTYLPTGAFGKGIGAGHTSLEPGMLARYKWSDELFWHGELRFMFPLGGTPGYQGEVLRYGLGWSHLLYENDSFAILDTVEFVGWTVLDGQKFDFERLVAVDIAGDHIFHIYPGLRFVKDSGGDLGVCELGVSGTVGMGSSSWYDGMLRFEMRWIY